MNTRSVDAKKRAYPTRCVPSVRLRGLHHAALKLAHVTLSTGGTHIANLRLIPTIKLAQVYLECARFQDCPVTLQLESFVSHAHEGEHQSTPLDRM